MNKLREELMQRLTTETLEPQEVASALPSPPEKIAEAIGKLRDEGKIYLNGEGKITINR